MNKKFLRSLSAIPLGWIVSFVGCMITMIVIAIFYPETFKPGVQLPVGWLLIILSISSIYGIIGGFVTAVIAQRSEIKHAIGLILVTLLISICLMCTDKNAAQVPNWYRIAGLILVVLSILLGGWLRMKQRVLLDKTSEGMIRTVKKLRLLIGICVSFITFVIVVFLGTTLGGIGFLKILQKFFGEDYHGIVFLPMFIVSVFLSFLLSRYIFRRII
jgi:uncharacterized membrane protein YsdA (DUF1294 family)